MNHLRRMARELRSLLEDDEINRLEVALVSCVILSAAVFRWVETSQGWFWADDWAFLARDAGSIDGWLKPNWGHWNTIPMLAYRSLFEVFGMDFFPGYHAFRVVGHAAFAGVFWWTLRWRGGGRWVSMILAGFTVVLSSTYDYKAIAIGIWVAALGLIIASTLIERIDEPTRRDSLMVGGLLLAAVMSTGIGALGTASLLGIVLIRRRWAWVPSLGAVLAIYGAWYLNYRDSIIVSDDIGPFSSTTPGELPRDLVRLFHLSLDQLTIPDTGLGPALLVAFGVALVRLARRNEVGLMATAMLITVVLYYVGIHVNRIQPGVSAIETPRYANTPYYLLVPAFVAALPRPRALLSTLTVLALGIGLVIGQAAAFSSATDPLVAWQKGVRNRLAVVHQLAAAGEPVVPFPAIPFGVRVPGKLLDAKGWPTLENPSEQRIRRERGWMRVDHVSDLAPASPSDKFLARELSVLHVDGHPLTECTDPAGTTLTYEDIVAFRVQIRDPDPADPSSVTVTTTDSFGVGKYTINQADFSVFIVLAPEDETAILTLDSKKTILGVCPFDDPAPGG